MKGIIYKIVCNETNEVYYGSTTQKINERILEHKKKCRYWKAGKYNYVSSFQIIDRNNYNYEVVEEVDYLDKRELEERERWYIVNNACINKNIPTRTMKEHYEDNKDIIKEKMKQYQQANKDTIKEYQKEYREANKEKMKEYYQANKEKIKEYYQANKEQKKEYDKAYQQANKDKINARRRLLYQQKKNNVIIE
jgi:hypothetical protein